MNQFGSRPLLGPTVDRGEEKRAEAQVERVSAGVTSCGPLCGLLKSP